MTPSQLEVATRHVDTYTQQLGYKQPNMRFVQGNIEDLAAAGIPDNSIDIVISNCVINLSPAKDKVLAEVHRVLAPRGEMYFSDVYCDRRLPDGLRTHPVLLGGWRWGCGQCGAAAACVLQLHGCAGRGEVAAATHMQPATALVVVLVVLAWQHCCDHMAALL
jgi:SAM-dependent methyltransferase